MHKQHNFPRNTIIITEFILYCQLSCHYGFALQINLNHFWNYETAHTQLTSNVVKELLSSGITFFLFHAPQAN